MRRWEGEKIPEIIETNKKLRKINHMWSHIRKFRSKTVNFKNSFKLSILLLLNTEIGPQKLESSNFDKYLSDQVPE